MPRNVVVSVGTSWERPGRGLTGNNSPQLGVRRPTRRDPHRGHFHALATIPSDEMAYGISLGLAGGLRRLTQRGIFRALVPTQGGLAAKAADPGRHRRALRLVSGEDGRLP